MPAFPPIAGSDTRVLILGSMPGRKSLEERQYYAHPRNAFWWIMSQLFEFDDTLDYQQRVALLTGAGVALWDVLHDCKRPGSLDSDIQRDSEIPNDLNAFIESHPGLRLIVFNGTAAQQLFSRHCQSVLSAFPRVETVRLPSTSPAHASLTRDQKLQLWKRAIRQTGVTAAGQ